MKAETLLAINMARCFDWKQYMLLALAGYGSWQLLPRASNEPQDDLLVGLHSPENSFAVSALAS